MKKILFDLRSSQPLNNHKFHGGAEYTRIIFLELVKQIDEITCVYFEDLYLDPQIVQICKERDFRMFDLNKISLQKVLDENAFNLYYIGLPEAYRDYKINFRKCLILGTIHGFRDLEIPYDDFQLFYNNSWKEILKFFLNKYWTSILFNISIKRYKALFNRPNFNFIFVSEHTKASAQVFFPNINFKNSPVYYSPSTSLVEFELNFKQFEREKYWLIINGGRWIKNSLRAIKAFDQLFSESPQINGKVIIIGIDNSSHIIKNIVNKSRFETKNYLDKIDLYGVIKNAYCLVFPSLNEGFGYPPLEAMKFGVPVLSSSFSSIPEICDNAVLYFNPLSINEIKNRIIQIEDKRLHEQYSKKGTKRFEEVLARQKLDLQNIINLIKNIN